MVFVVLCVLLGACAAQLAAQDDDDGDGGGGGGVELCLKGGFLSNR